FYLIFPDEYNEKALCKLFQRWGRVLDIFISRKLNTRKQHFGFVRFQRVGDTHVLERKLDSIWIGTWKMRVNIPKYYKNEFPKNKRNSKPKTKTVVDRKVWSKKIQQHSFAQVVKSGSESFSQGASEDDMFHLGSRVSKATNVQSIKESFLLGRFNFVRVRYLGEKYVFLSCEDESIIVKSI
ncbi:hypothetical protein PHAVU_009G256300, partial [Phaseolus vulgaris]